MEPEKPSKNEDEYFTRQELERRKKAEKERAARMAQTERDKLKEIHQMKCPKCGMDLHTFEMEGIKLDRCVSCNGTWFDEGEIEQLISHHDRGVFGRVMSVFRP